MVRFYASAGASISRTPSSFMIVLSAIYLGSLMFANRIIASARPRVKPCTQGNRI